MTIFGKNVKSEIDVSVNGKAWDWCPLCNGRGSYPVHSQNCDGSAICANECPIEQRCGCTEEVQWVIDGTEKVPFNGPNPHRHYMLRQDGCYICYGSTDISGCWLSPEWIKDQFRGSSDHLSTSR